MSAVEDWGNDPQDFQCALIQQARDTETAVISFRQAIEGIRDGRWARQVSAVQQAYEAGLLLDKGPAKIAGIPLSVEESRIYWAKDHAGPAKKLLPGILFSGTFSKRSDRDLLQHSGLICADLDGLGERVGQVKELIASDPHVIAAFVSPTGSGLKVVFRCDQTKDHKTELFPALQCYVMQHFGLEVDESCSNVSRICFVSHDPDAFLADDAKPLPPVEIPEEYQPENYSPPPSNGDLRPGDDYNARTDPTPLLIKHGWTKTGKVGWRRPDKSEGISATFGYVPNRLWVFSSSTQFTPRRLYSPWHIYAILEHGSDFHAAARELGRLGYGTPAKTRQQKNLERYAPEPGVAQKTETTSRLTGRRVSAKTPPQEPVTRLFLVGKPICTPGNITTLISRAKTGKTATLGAATAAIITAATKTTALKPDNLGFTAANPEGHAVIVIDTEQSPFDAYTCYKRSLDRAGEQDDPKWLYHYTLVGMGPDDLHKALDEAIELAKKECDQVFTIILDGVADFVNSVNDEAECNGFVNWLRERTVTHNCPAICVIHSNEGVKTGDDGRGHLGKQLTRKAESNLLLKKTEDITTITSEKQRKAPITEADGVAFQWSDEAQRHVSCESGERKPTKMGRPPKWDYALMLTCVPGPDEKPKSPNAIFSKVTNIPCSIPSRSFKDVIAKWHEAGEVVRTGNASIGFEYRRAY